MKREAPRRRQPPESYVEGILKGDRVVLSQAITLVESGLSEDQDLAAQVVEECLPHSGKSLRIGITGVPGVGKSTFIEELGQFVIRKHDRRLAVLAIDPTSSKSRGSILGDKTRMSELARNEHAYIRPSPTGGSLGGVARKTREAIVLCEAAGFDVVIVETVGVGQSETAVHSMVDFFLLLMLAGAGDELQGIKRGIMEMADALAITKADRENVGAARRARAEYSQALGLFPEGAGGWRARVILTSAVERTGIDEVWQCFLEHETLMKSKGVFEARRREQARYWFEAAIGDLLLESFQSNERVRTLRAGLEAQVLDKKRSPFSAARELVRVHLGQEAES
ncbi:MAG: methylmalonyl Co-A mutase-associated GTPase MeaB [Spirochaetales bacterium]|nr:methylmalonyl Co-A mutase-associated GTPase MeaB [Leptospiraceae bacterium]MCP5483266.1 methylmalonyl Co-A mutase-associated GTPase MeaB [Spirochaetales bacterium]